MVNLRDLCSSANSEIPSSIPATISAVGTFLGAKAKFLPFWSATVSALFNGLLEIFSTHLSRLIASLGSELFDCGKGLKFFRCILLILQYYSSCGS